MKIDQSSVDSFQTETFIELVRKANQLPTIPERVSAVQKVLEQTIEEHPHFLSNSFLVSNPDAYARWPLYVDPDGHFSILVMVWEPGQGTLLHNHDGLWIVEGVYKGKIHIINYNYQGKTDKLYQFVPTDDQICNVGSTDYRIPPEEYHIVKNDQTEVAVTIHVFGGILKRFDSFESVEGGYKKVVSPISLNAAVSLN